MAVRRRTSCGHDDLMIDFTGDPGYVSVELTPELAQAWLDSAGIGMAQDEAKVSEYPKP